MLRVLLLALVLGLAGCAGDGLVEVKGRVTLDGAPIEKGTIGFLPVGGEGPTAETPIIAGDYTVRVAPGKKTVRIFGYEKIGEYRVTPEGPMIDDLKQFVPPQFNEQSTLEREIAADLNEPLPFELSTKP